MLVLVSLGLAVVHGSSSLRADMGHPSSAPPAELVQALNGNLGTVNWPSRAPHCSAVCLSPSLIVTAGHCIHGPVNGIRADAETLNFSLARPQKARAQAKRQALSTSIVGLVSGGTKASFRVPIEADRDWAILRLRQPICRRGGLTVAKELDNVSAGTSTAPILWVAGVSEETNAQAQTFTVRPCQNARLGIMKAEIELFESDFAVPDRLLFHNCKPGPMASGSPVLSFEGGRAHVIGLHVGTYVRSRVIKDNNRLIKQRLSSRPISHIAIRASEFTRPVSDLVNLR